MIVGIIGLPGQVKLLAKAKPFMSGCMVVLFLGFLPRKNDFFLSFDCPGMLQT